MTIIIYYLLQSKKTTKMNNRNTNTEIVDKTEIVDIELKKIKGRDIVSAKIKSRKVSIYRLKVILKAMQKARLTRLRLLAKKIKVHNIFCWKPLIGQLDLSDIGHYTFWSSWTNKNGDLNRVALFRDSTNKTYRLVWFDLDRPLRTKQWVEYPETLRESEETTDVKTNVKTSNNPFSLLKTFTKTDPKVVNEFPQIGTPKPIFNKNWKKEALSMKKPIKRSVLVKTPIPKSPVIDRKDDDEDKDEEMTEFVEDEWSNGFNNNQEVDDDVDDDVNENDDDWFDDQYDNNEDQQWFDNYEDKYEEYEDQYEHY